MHRFACVGTLVLVTGCSGTLPAQYQPQTYDQIDNSRARIGDFMYLPAAQSGVESNQLQNTALGNIKIGTDVADFVQRATALELQRAGVDLDETNEKEIRGEIHELMLDDLGYSVDWRYRVAYIVIDSSGNEIFSKTYSASPRNTGKFGNPSDYTSTLNEVVLEPIEMFFDDIEARNLLEIEPNAQGGQPVT
jgi:hypothetical protein